MINRSKVSLKKSKDALETFGICNGEEWLDSACYDAQQALEFLMKGILLDNGVYFGKTHDIAYLNSLLEDENIIFDKQKDLESLAGTITSWESEWINGTGIRTTINTVRRIHNIYENLLDTFLEMQSKLNDTSAKEITEEDIAKSKKMPDKSNY
jgi:HEPN domain-containing protein